MSYDITFYQGEEACILPFPPPQGGIYCVGEEFRIAWLNITYNYARIYHKYGLSINKLEKKRHTCTGGKERFRMRQNIDLSYPENWK